MASGSEGSYKSIERIFPAVCLVYLTYIISAVMAKPDWTEVAVKMMA